jgi:hypothetical protein
MEWLAAEARVKRNAREDRPDIENVFAEQAEAEHKKKSGDRRARHLRARPPINERGCKGQQPGAPTTSADSPDPK